MRFQYELHLRSDSETSSLQYHAPTTACRITEVLFQASVLHEQYPGHCIVQTCIIPHPHLCITKRPQIISKTILRCLGLKKVLCRKCLVQFAVIPQRNDADSTGSELHHRICNSYILLQPPVFRYPRPQESCQQPRSSRSFANHSKFLCPIILASLSFNSGTYHPSNMQAVLKSATAFLGLVGQILCFICL